MNSSDIIDRRHLEVTAPYRDTTLIDTNLSQSMSSVIYFDPIESLTVHIHFSLAILVNTLLAISVIKTFLKSAAHLDTSFRGSSVGQRIPVVDMILLIMSFSAIIRIFIRSGLQLICIYGICITGVPLCRIHGFLNSLLHYLYLWIVTLFVQDRYTKHRAPHNYFIKCSHLDVVITFIGVFFMISVHVMGPVWGFSQYRFRYDERTCSVDTNSPHSCAYLIFSWMLISLPAVVPLSVWTVILIVKHILPSLSAAFRRLRTSDPTVVHHQVTSEPSSVHISIHTSSLPSSIAHLSKSLVMCESREIISVILVSLFYLLSIVPKAMVDLSSSCFSSLTLMENSYLLSPSLSFWTSFANEFGATLIVPLILMTIHPKIISIIWPLKGNFKCPFSCQSSCSSCGNTGQSEQSHQQHELIYMTARPSTSASSGTPIPSTSTSVAMI